MVAGKTIKLCEVVGPISAQQLPLLGSLPLPREPRLIMKCPRVFGFLPCAVPVGRQTLEVRLKLKCQPRMTGGDQVVVDDLGLPTCVVRPHMTTHAGPRPLRKVLSINEARSGGSRKAGSIMRMQPIA